MDPSLNVHGQPLEACSIDPLTGWYRDGCCNTDEHDRGLHTVCCIVNEAFLPGAESLFEKGLELLRELIFDPLVEDGAFSADYVAREKDLLATPREKQRRTQGLRANKPKKASPWNWAGSRKAGPGRPDRRPDRRRGR